MSQSVSIRHLVSKSREAEQISKSNGQGSTTTTTTEAKSAPYRLNWALLPHLIRAPPASSRALYPPAHLLPIRQLAAYGRMQRAYEAPARALPPADVRGVRQKR